MSAEIHPDRMFKNEQTFRFEYVRPGNQSRNILKPWQIPGRVGKYNIVSCFTDPEVCADVSMYDFDVFKSYSGNNFFYTTYIFPVLFNHMNSRSSAGRKLIGYTACARKKIKNKYSFKVSYIIQNIEQALTCESSCRSYTQTVGQIYSPAPVFAAYNSHLVILKRLR